MDANVGTRSKILRSSNVVQGYDYISSLSKDIVTSILSRLPTKEAVHTSVLSTTWVDMWKSITKVDFNDALFRDRDILKRVNIPKFESFVNGVLLNLDLSNIQDFSLSLSNQRYNPSMLSSWISSVLTSKLQNLYIKNADLAFISSRSLAKCNCLVNLVLGKNCTIKFPSKFCLPNLQVLRFERVRFVRNSTSEHSKEIILVLPSLKLFETRHCVCFNIILHAPMLESFSFMLHDYWLSDDELLDLQGSAFKISSSPTITFACHGHLLHNFFLLSQPSTFTASVELFIVEYSEERVENTCFRWHMLIKHFNEVKCLKIKLNWLLQRRNDYYFANLPVFGRLVYLEMETVAVETMLNIVKNSKNLRTLVVIDAPLSFDKNVLTSVALPSCFQSSLKDVQFKQFKGIYCELTLINFVLKNVVALEKMTIFPYRWLRDSNLVFEEVKRKILSFHRRSSIVAIEFNVDKYMT